MRKLLLFLVLCAGGLTAQTVTFPNPLRSGGTLPATCTPGSLVPALFVLTSGTPVTSSEVYECTAANTWSIVGTGGGGTCGALGGNVTGTCAATSVKGIRTGLIGGLPPTCTVGDIYFATDASAGANIYQCTATNTWSAPAPISTTAYTQAFTTQTSVALTHNLGTLGVITQCFDNASPAQNLEWNTLKTTNANTVTVTFTNAQSGTCIVLSGGGAGGGSGAAGGDLTGTYPAPTIKPSVALSGTPTAVTGTTGDGTTQIATDAFVANALAITNTAQSVQAATIAVLSNTPTYNNGTAGVGATLTAGSNGALTIDGYVVLLNDRVLIKNQASALQNGVYTLTTLGTGGVPYVLTRAIDYNTVPAINYGGTVPVLQGSTLANTGWNGPSPLIATIGTDAISYAQNSTGTGGVPANGNVKAQGNLTNGNAVKGAGGKTIVDAGVAFSSLTQTIASGAKALNTTAVAGNSCNASAQTATATGTLSTDAFSWVPNADITAVTGYNVAGVFGLEIFAWPTADTVNFKVCNTTTSSITPGAVTLNWRVTR